MELFFLSKQGQNAIPIVKRLLHFPLLLELPAVEISSKDSKRLLVADRTKLILTATQIITSGCFWVFRPGTKQFQEQATSSTRCTIPNQKCRINCYSSVVQSFLSALKVSNRVWVLPRGNQHLGRKPKGWVSSRQQSWGKKLHCGQGESRSSSTKCWWASALKDVTHPNKDNKSQNNKSDNY